VVVSGEFSYGIDKMGSYNDIDEVAARPQVQFCCKEAEAHWKTLAEYLYSTSFSLPFDTNPGRVYINYR
jgi:hypothetical protein